MIVLSDFYHAKAVTNIEDAVTDPESMILDIDLHTPFHFDLLGVVRTICIHHRQALYRNET